MKILFKAKDGGPESNVTGYWLIESKRLGSIALLRFSKGSREAFHNHAFNAWSLILWGKLRELVRVYSAVDPDCPLTFVKELKPSLKPIYTARDRLHQVHGVTDNTWALTIRGPWKDTWKEFFEKTGKWVTLTNGRKVEEVQFE